MLNLLVPAKCASVLKIQQFFDLAIDVGAHSTNDNSHMDSSSNNPLKSSIGSESQNGSRNQADSIVDRTSLIITLLRFLILTGIMVACFAVESAVFSRAQAWSAPHVYTMSSFFLLIFNFVGIPFEDGWKNLRKGIWNESSLLYIPIALGYLVQTVGSAYISSNGGAAMNQVVKQSRLAVVAIYGFALLKKSYSATQTFVLAHVCLTIMVFVITQIADNTGAMSNFYIGLAGLLASGLASCMWEKVSKAGEYGVSTTMSAFYLILFVAEYLVMKSNIINTNVPTYDFWTFKNWDISAWLILVSLVIRTVSANFVLVWFDSVWKELAMAIGLGSSYLINRHVLGRISGPLILSVCAVSVACGSVTFAVATREKNAIQQLTEEKELS